MSRKMSKLELLQEFRYTEKAKEVTDMVDLERKMKAYARQNDITVRSYNGDLSWPIGIKLVVIAVIWVVLKDQVL